MLWTEFSSNRGPWGKRHGRYVVASTSFFVAPRNFLRSSAADASEERLERIKMYLDQALIAIRGDVTVGQPRQQVCPWGFQRQRMSFKVPLFPNSRAAR